MSFIVRNASAVVPFQLKDDFIDVTLAPAEHADLESIFAEDQLYMSSVSPYALYTAITNGSIIRRNETETADIPAVNAFDDAIWRWSPTRGQKEALAGTYGTPGAANAYYTFTDPTLERVKGEVLTVAKSGGQYTSVAAALTSISDSSPSLPYTIKVSPGVYVEPVLVMKTNVMIEGENLETTFIEADAVNHHVVEMVENSFLMGLTLRGAGPGYAGVYCENIGYYALLHKVSIDLCDVCIICKTTNVLGGKASSLFLEYVDLNSNATDTACMVVQADAYSCYVEAENFYAAGVVSNPPVGVLLSGVGASFVASTGACYGVDGTGTALQVSDGADLECSGLKISDWNAGVLADTVGTGPQVELTGLTFEDNTINLNIASPTATGFFIGESEYIKNLINDANSFYVIGEEFNVLRVGKKGGDFTSIAAAIAVITAMSDATDSHRYLIRVAPGLYHEPEIKVPPFVAITGHSLESVIVEPTSASQHIFTLSPNTSVNFMTVRGAGVGYAAFNCADVRYWALLHKVSIWNSDTSVLMTAVSSDSYLYLEYVDTNQNNTETVSLHVIGDGTHVCYLEGENTFITGVTSNPPHGLIAEGSTAKVVLTAGGFFGYDNTGIAVSNKGADVELMALAVEFWSTGIHTDPGFPTPNVEMSAIAFANNSIDINVEASDATGYFVGESPYVKTLINKANAFYVSGRDLNVLRVFKKGGDFSSVKAAVDYISTHLSASATNLYGVQVGAGVFIEDTITLTPYITLFGQSKSLSIIEARVPNQDLIIPATNTSLKDLTLTGSTGSGHALVNWTNNIGPGSFSMRNCLFSNAYLGIKQSSVGYFTNSAYDSISYSGGMVEGFIEITDDGVNASIATLTDCGSVALLGNGVIAHGPVTSVVMNACVLHSLASGSTGVRIYNGCALYMMSVDIDGFDHGFVVENTGVAPSIRIVGCSIPNDTIEILHPSTTGMLSIIALHNKVSSASTTVAMFISDPDGLSLIGDLNHGDILSQNTKVNPFIQHFAPSGVFTLLDVLTHSGLTVTVASGFGYVQRGVHPNDHLWYTSWNQQNITVASNASQYIYIDTNGSGQVAASVPDIFQNIYLGHIVTDASSCYIVNHSRVGIERGNNLVQQFLRDGIGPIFGTGCIVTKPSAAQLAVSSGYYYYGTNKYLPSGSSPVTFLPFRTDGSGGWVKMPSTTFVSTSASGWTYDNGGVLTTIPSGSFAKHELYLAGDGVDETYALVYGQTLFATQAVAEVGVIPVKPPFFTDNTVGIAGIIVTQGSDNIVAITDLRPTLGFKAEGATSTLIHGSLLGLTSDDHKQYLLVSGTRAMTGDLNMGGNSVTNVSLVDGVDVSAHASRHLPNGSDPLTTGLPSSISATSTTGSGIQNSFARSDHVHAVSVGVASTLLPDQTNASGSSSNLIRADHIHNVPSAVPVSIDASSTNTRGSAASFALSDHKHSFSVGVPVTLLPDQTNSSGASASVSRTDHIHNIPSGTPIGITTSGSNSRGIAASFALSDHGHALSTGVVITQLPDQANAAGASGSVAKADHVHNIATAAAVGLTAVTTNTQGSASTFGRSDHTHAISSAIPVSIGAVNTLGSSASFARADHIHSLITDGIIVNTAGSLSISLGLPVTQTPDQTNAPGSATSVARSDHVHNVPTGLAASVATTNASGTAASFAHSDHVHQGVASITLTSGTARYGSITLTQGSGITITDVSGNYTISSNVTGSGLKIKAGTVTAGSFAGNPKKYTVTFASAFSSAAYSINITGVDNRNWSYDSATKAAGSFVINSNANAALTGEVSWTAIFGGESN